MALHTLASSDAPPESLSVEAVVSLRDKQGGVEEVTKSALKVRGTVPA